MTPSANGSTPSFSFSTIPNKRDQHTQKIYFNFWFEVTCVVLYTAIKDRPKKIKSKDFHQRGWAPSEIINPVWAKKRKGVAKQCTKHKLLAIIPNVSALLCIRKMFKIYVYLF